MYVVDTPPADHARCIESFVCMCILPNALLVIFQTIVIIMSPFPSEDWSLCVTNAWTCVCFWAVSYHFNIVASKYTFDHSVL